jgi:hypothetical protein
MFGNGQLLYEDFQINQPGALFNKDISFAPGIHFIIVRSDRINFSSIFMVL